MGMEKQAKQKYFSKQPESYWMASAVKPDDAVMYPPLNEDIKVDVAIVGGGIAGLSCAYLLSKEGLKVAIIEASQIMHGTTGHTTAKITSQHSLIYNKIKNQMSEEFAKQYADANEAAIRYIEKIVEENKIECDLITQSAYVYTQQDEYIQQIRDEVQTAASLGIKAAFVEEIPFPIPIKGAVRFDGQAQFHPYKYLIGLTKSITNSGCRIFERSRVMDIEEADNYVLTTQQGKKVTAEKVIIASHYPFYNKPALYFSRIYLERSYVVAIKAKQRYPGGMYITAEDPGRSLRYQNTENGELILVGGEHHKTGQGIDTIKHYEALMDFAYDTFELEDIPYRWSTQDCMTLDGVPYVGHFTSKTPNLYIATGFGKWGMTNSTVSAMLIKDLIVHGESPWQNVYNPSRQTIEASAKEFVVQNLNVAENLIAGKLSPLPKNVDIKPGEGKAIEADGKRTGAYRDENGNLHLVNTTCTHMGCELNWNSAERSWDCPCHGSRFSYKGDVIEGPAIQPLTMNNDVNTIEKLLKDDF